MRYPIGVQSFEKLRSDGYTYIDKTDIVYRLAQKTVCFLCRPRRFGKSLLISTLEAYFRGKKELFEGLKMEALEQEWKAYPVLHIDFANENYHDKESLRTKINKHLMHWEKEYGAEPYSETIGSRFQYIIAQAHKKTGNRAVVLIDEYDKPMLDTLDTPLEQEHREVLKELYSTFKACDDDLRFVMLTGVTKFSQVSV
ncbi:MAG: AAA family ATPase, partial [Bacteroidales bacterium]|nr:AAA family ATPase [Candidatus Physcousia equi]